VLSLHDLEEHVFEVGPADLQVLDGHAVTCTMRPVTRARSAMSGGSVASVLKRSIVDAVPANSCEVRSSATMRPCFSIAMRWQSASASSR
jgi:hypothetical protein